MDAGLLSGLAEGLKQGTSSYLEARQNRQQQQKDALKMALEAKAKGLNLVKDENGEVIGFDKDPNFVDQDKFLKDLQIKSLSQKIAEAPKEKEREDKLFNLKYQKEQSDLAKERSKISEEQKKIQLQNTPEGRVDKLGADAKAKVGSLLSMEKTLSDYEDAFKSGERPQYIDSNTPIIGGLVSASKISEAVTKLTDDIGRLRSGGAISQDEEARFKKMLPAKADADPDALRKLANFRQELKIKLGTYGILPEDVPALKQRFGVSNDEAAQRARYEELLRRDGR